MMAYLLKMIESLQGLVSGRIHKINQPENDTIIIVIRQNRKIINYFYRLASFSRLQLTTKNTTIHLPHQCLQEFSVNTLREAL